MSVIAYKDIRARLSYSVADGERLDRLLELLAAVADGGSLASAAQRMGMSYRSAWGLVWAWQQRLRRPLLHMARGRGSQLAPLGLRLLEAERAARRLVEPQLALAADQFQQALAAEAGRSAKPLRLHASHDLALEMLPDLLAEKGCRVELEFRGSIESLEDYRAHRCELAGVHCPRGPIGDPVRGRYLAVVRGRGHHAIKFATRTQGLIVAAGNPHGIAGIGDLLRPGLRYINRQSGAGTRLLLDLLLAQRGISPSAVPGYTHAEFTHAAVAATVASGAADAGLGIAAAAARFGLEFVPLLQEDYFLIGRTRTAPSLERISEVLRSADFRSAATELGGYDVSDAGSMQAAEEVLRGPTAND